MRRERKKNPEKTCGGRVSEMRWKNTFDKTRRLDRIGGIPQVSYVVLEAVLGVSCESIE